MLEPWLRKLPAFWSGRLVFGKFQNDPKTIHAMFLFSPNVKTNDSDQNDDNKNIQQQTRAEPATRSSWHPSGKSR